MKNVLAANDSVASKSLIMSVYSRICNHPAIFLFLLSLIIRLIFLNQGLWHHDSVQFALNVESRVRSLDFNPMQYKGGVSSLNALLFYPFYLLGIHSAESFITVNSALFASLSVALLYLFLELLFGKPIAFLSALIFSLSPVNLVTTTFANSHPFSIFFVLLSFYLLIKGVTRPILLPFSGAVLGAVWILRPTEAFLFLPHVFLFLWKCRRNIIAKGIITYAPTLLLSLLFFSSMYGEFFGLYNYNGLSIPGIFLLQAVAWLFAGSSIVGGLATIIGALRIGRSRLLFLALWFIPTFLYHALVLSPSPRFFMASIIPISVLMAYGVFSIRGQKVLIPIIALVILSLMLATALPIINFRHQFSGGKQLAMQIKELVPANSTIILYSDDAVFVEYYASLMTIACNNGNNSEPVTSRIDKLLSENKSVYYSETCNKRIRSPDTDLFYRQFVQRYLAEEIATNRFEDYHRSELQISELDFRLYKVMQK